MNGMDPIRDVACDRCEEAFDRAESLLDEGRLAEALQVLRENEAELRRLARPAVGPALPREEHRLVSPLGRDAAVAVPEGAGYAVVRVGSARLSVLLGRTGRLLHRCEAMRDGTVEELRLLRANRRFQSDSSVAGTWFSREA
jgi:hypothetical protein